VSRRGALRPRIQGPFRDARLFLVAVEGAKTEPAYFDALVDVLQSSRIRVRVLPPPSTSSTDVPHPETGPIEARPGASAPQHVATRLMDEANSLHGLHGVLSFDQLWIVIDFDRWEPQIRALAQEARNRRFRLAVSRPSFELWLLLHFADDISAIDARTSIKAQQGTCEEELKRCAPTYSKNTKTLPSAEITLPRICDAADRALLLDDAQGRPDWPNAPGSHVYKLIEELLHATKLTTRDPSAGP